MAYSVAQNTTFLTVASVLQKIISFGYFILVARLIGVENTGNYFYAISFTTIFTVIADFGLAPVLTREVAKYPERAGEYLSSVVTMKILFGLGAYGLILVFCSTLGYNSTLTTLILISGCTMFFDNLQTAFLSIFRGQRNLKYESLVVVLAQFLTFIIGTVALFSHWPLYSLILAYTVPSALLLIVSVFIVHSKYNVSPFALPNRSVVRQFLLYAWPFALAGILGRLYSYSDSILMSKFLSAKELGYWSVPYKITFAFQFIPVALSASVYPAMSNMFLTDKQKVGELFVKSWRYLFSLAFPLAFGLVAVARPVIVTLYGSAFEPAVPVLSILVISLIGSFLTFITGAVLNATNNQTKQTSTVAIALMVNIAANVILIPRFGIIGAALSALIGNAVLTGVGYAFATRVVPIDTRALARSFGKTFFPALIMAFVVYALTMKISFFVTVPLGALVYTALLWYGKVIDKEMVQRLLLKLRLQ